MLCRLNSGGTCLVLLNPTRLAKATPSIALCLDEFFCMQQSELARAHTCFRLDIRFPIGIDDQSLIENEDDLLDLWHGHSHRVIRDPEDLLAHTRRVRLCHEPALNDRLLGALQDLEFVLGSKGDTLLGRLKNESAPILSKLAPPDDTDQIKGRVLPTIIELLNSEALNDLPVA